MWHFAAIIDIATKNEEVLDKVVFNNFICCQVKHNLIVPQGYLFATSFILRTFFKVVLIELYC